jgi:hypothetical protein
MPCIVSNYFTTLNQHNAQTCSFDINVTCHTEYHTCFSLQGAIIRESNQSFVRSRHSMKESDGYNVGISL